jgi:hypothetical protein
MNVGNLLCSALSRHLNGGSISVPEAGRLAWQWFCDLHATRSHHFSGPNPISCSEIETYARVNGWPLEPRHFALIRALDDVYLLHAATRRQTLPNGVKVLPTVSSTPLSAGMVDVLFGA